MTKAIWKGELLRYHRKILGLTASELGAKVGTEHSHVSMWENDVCEPHGSTLVLLAKALGITPDVLFEFQEV